MVNVDASEVYELAFDLSRAPDRMQDDAARTLKKSALQIKRRMIADFSGHRYAGSLPGAFEFQRIGDMSYEIGELDSGGPQWGLAGILAYGTSNNAPVVNHTMSLWQEAPVMVRHLIGAAGDDVLGGPR